MMPETNLNCSTKHPALATNPQTTANPEVEKRQHKQAQQSFWNELIAFGVPIATLAVAGYILFVKPTPEIVQLLGNNFTSLAQNSISYSASSSKAEFAELYARYDQAAALGEMPDDLLVSTFTQEEETQSGLKSTTRDQFNADLKDRFSKSFALTSHTKVDNAVLRDDHTVIISATVEETRTTPLKLFIPNAENQDAQTKIVLTQTQESVDTWVKEGNASWWLQKRTLLGTGNAHVRMADDSEGAPDTQKPQEDLIARIQPFYEAVDQERSQKTFPDDAYASEWKQTDTKQKTTAKEALQKLFTEGLANKDSLSFTTKVDEAIQLSGSTVLVKTTRRCIFAGANGKISGTGTRKEVDYIKRDSANQGWKIERTVHLSDSPILTSLGI